MLERPSKLTSYRFDQLADQINQRVMPAEADVERYVGLEHLDPDSLRIRRWGDPSEVESTKLRFEPGDIIFGKRRVYQRKVAVADTEGICSAHAMVLRAKPDTVLPEFLPFFMQSDLFMERALSISVGSLSPTINWKTLAKEKFLLPPIQEQARLVEVLSAAHANTDSLNTLLQTAKMVLKTYSLLWFSKAKAAHGSVPLESFVSSSAYGPRFPSSKYSDSPNCFSIRTTDFTDPGAINYGQVPGALLPKRMVDEHRLQDGDFLLSRSGAYAGMVRIFSPSEEDLKGYIPAAFLIRFRLDQERLLPAYLREFCESELGERALANLTQGSAQPNISGSDFKGMSLPIPKTNSQMEFLMQVKQFRSAELEARNRLARSQFVFRKLTQAVFHRTE